jgi:adenine-specific DNA-methyltransferase
MPEPKKHPSISVPDLTAERIQSLRDLLPEAYSEGKIDFEKLRAALGDLADESPERYTFSWAGKRDAIRLLQTPTRATLVPCPEESLDADGEPVIARPAGAKQSPRSQETAASSEERPSRLGLSPSRGGRPRSDMQSNNIFIEGDNLEALKLLYKPYFGCIKMIYIDPPYNTGNDFIYPDASARILAFIPPGSGRKLQI